MIADDDESLLAVVLAIAGGRSPHVGVGRLAPAVETLGDQNEHAADDRCPVLGGDARINPGHGDGKEVHRLPPARFEPVDYRLHSRLRTENVTLSPWTISPHSDAMVAWRITAKYWLRT